MHAVLHLSSRVKTLVMTSPLKAIPAYLFKFVPLPRKAGENRDMEGALRNARYSPLGDASSEEIKLRNDGNEDVDEALLQDGKSAPAPCPSCWREEKKQRSRLHTFVRVIVVLLSIFGLIDLCIRAAASIRQPPAWHALTGADPTCYCGNSTAEALALGCKYDSLAQGWLPDHCRDDELAEEFEKSGPNEGGGWNFYRDKNHTIPMSYDEVSMLADTGGHWFVEWDWHAAHVRIRRSVYVLWDVC